LSNHPPPTFPPVSRLLRFFFRKMCVPSFFSGVPTSLSHETPPRDTFLDGHLRPPPFAATLPLAGPFDLLSRLPLLLLPRKVSPPHPHATSFPGIIYCIDPPVLFLIFFVEGPTGLLQPVASGPNGRGGHPFSLIDAGTKVSPPSGSKFSMSVYPLDHFLLLFPQTQVSPDDDFPPPPPLNPSCEWSTPPPVLRRALFRLL